MWSIMEVVRVKRDTVLFVINTVEPLIKDTIEITFYKGHFLRLQNRFPIVLIHVSP